MKKQLSDEEIFSMLKKEYVKVPEGLDREILAKLKVRKVNFFKARLKIYSIAASIVLAIMISLNLLILKSPINKNINVVYQTNLQTSMEHDIFNDDELLLAYDKLYDESFDLEDNLMDEDQDLSYDDELYEDVAFLENM